MDSEEFPRLNKVETGLWTVGPNPLVKPANLTLAVHPYFDYDEILGKHPEYNKNLASFLEEDTGTLLVLEEHLQISPTAKAIIEAGKKSGVALIETYPETSDMVHHTWDDLVAKLRKASLNGVSAIGGYFRDKPSGNYDGCLGCAIWKLEQKGIDIKPLDGLTF
ncbi:hypothetical protein ACFL1B_03425 [Nanoarchaeota archaeon]